eukprot:6214335-Pleurochrysis_carterae.AAC.1
MHCLVPGIEFNTKGSRGALFLIYADDGIILTDSIHTLQLAMEVMWVMTKILGLNVQIKEKKKTAWSGVYYNEEGKGSDITGWGAILGNTTETWQSKRRLNKRYDKSDTLIEGGTANVYRVVRSGDQGRPIKGTITPSFGVYLTDRYFTGSTWSDHPALGGKCLLVIILTTIVNGSSAGGGLTRLRGGFDA